MAFKVTVEVLRRFFFQPVFFSVCVSSLVFWNHWLIVAEPINSDLRFVRVANLSLLVNISCLIDEALEHRRTLEGFIRNLLVRCGISPSFKLIF